jgi:hypothetical protein
MIQLIQGILVMGHVKDTPHVREVEERYKTFLIGGSATWTDDYRTRIFCSNQNQWVGVFPLCADDVEEYKLF